MGTERWQRIQAAFDEAAGREPDEREAVLVRVCAGDPALRAEVEALLVHDALAECGGFLPEPPLAKVPALPVPGAGGDAGAGRVTLPGYEILAEIGRGGMGVVYKARQTAVNRLVALKMILTGGHAGPQELARFRKEARAVARLEHPHIVRLYDFGERAGLPYFSMELVEGGNLAQKLGGTPQPPLQAAQLVERLAHAVH